MAVNREETKEKAAGFVKKHGWTFPTFLDEKRVFYSKFTPKYVPYNVVIGPDMKLIYTDSGFDAAALTAAVEEAIAKAKDG